MGEVKLGFRPRDPHGEIRAGILRILPPEMSKTVGWRPIWWQKGVILGPLGFRARLAHPNQTNQAPQGPRGVICTSYFDPDYQLPCRGKLCHPK